MANTESDAGTQVTGLGPSTMSVADAVKLTITPPELTVRSTVAGVTV